MSIRYRHIGHFLCIPVQGNFDDLELEIFIKLEMLKKKCAVFDIGGVGGVGGVLSLVCTPSICVVN